LLQPDTRPPPPKGRGEDDQNERYNQCSLVHMAPPSPRGFCCGAHRRIRGEREVRGPLPTAGSRALTPLSPEKTPAIIPHWWHAQANHPATQMPPPHSQETRFSTHPRLKCHFDRSAERAAEKPPHFAHAGTKPGCPILPETKGWEVHGPSTPTQPHRLKYFHVLHSGARPSLREGP
jgi:hypothetical protein